MLWIKIALSIVLAIEALFLVARVIYKVKKNRDNDNANDNKSNRNNKNDVKTMAVLPILCAMPLLSDMAVCILLGVAVVAFAVAIVCTFIKTKNQADNQVEEVNGEELATLDSIADKEPEDSQVMVVGGVGALGDELSAEELQEEEEEGSEDDGISLKESLALAVAHSQIKINKASVAEWLSSHYGDEILLNRRVNKTKTGLPLADTHYVTVGAKKKCFVYVYELDGDKSMLLLKTDDETAKTIMDKYPMFVKSRFPKSHREHWYTLIPDSGFSSADEVFDVIALVLSNYTDSLRQASQEVREEIAKLEQVMKDNVSVQEAKELVSDAAASVLVTGRKHRKTGKKFAVNIDTLSDRYNEGDTVDINDLKAKGIVPKSANQVKILARGMLNKPLIVVADDFSVDAIKMIVLTGGEALWS